MRRIPIETAHWRRREFAAVARALIGRAPDEAIAALEREAAAHLGGATVFAVNSGRGAMAIALKLLQARAPNRKRVLIPEYVCPSVPAALARLGFETLCLPVGEDLNVLGDAAVAALDERVLAVVPVHMYAHIVDVRATAAEARAQGAGVIDDAAHIIGVSAADGMIPGTTGEFGFISLAQSKTLSCGNSGAGGLVIINDAKFLGPSEVEIASLPAARLTDLLRFALEERHIPPRDTLTWRIGDVYSRLVPGAVLPLELNITRIGATYASVALGQLATLAERITDKRRIAGLYADALADVPAVRFSQFAPGCYLSRVALMARSVAERNALREHLASRAIATRKGYPPPQAPMVGGGRPRDFAVIEVPSGFGLSEDSVARIAGSIHEFYERVE
ncbi:MAG: DegT/DnrJ/EryC1/StrS family aminotransferase [Alphaproteobacteria bacterium]